MKEISLKNLSKFEQIFSKNKQKHTLTLITIKSFIQRFEKFPELRERAKLFALTDQWENDGIFLMLFESANGYNVYLDSLNESCDIIKCGLKTLDFTTKTFSFTIRNEHREIIFQLSKELNLKIHEETNKVCLYISEKDVMNFNNEIPENFTLKSLSDENAIEINSVWPHRSKSSLDFVGYMVKYNLNLGLFDADSNLVAWCLRYDNGSLGLLQVNDQYLRKGFASLIVRAMSKKIAKECKSDVISLVIKGNQKSFDLFHKLQFEELCGYTFGLDLKK